MKSTTFRVHRSAVCVLIFNEVPFCSVKKKRNRRKKVSSFRSNVIRNFLKILSLRFVSYQAMM